MEIRARENNDKHENIVGSMLEILSWVDIMGPSSSKCRGIVIVPIATGSVNPTRRSTTAKFIRRDDVRLASLMHAYDIWGQLFKQGLTSV